MVVDLIEIWDEQSDGEQESQRGAEVCEADFDGAEPVAVGPNVLKVGIEAVHRRKEDSLIGGHDEDDWLREEDAEWALNCMQDLGPQR